jgi:hypothetical protein
MLATASIRCKNDESETTKTYPECPWKYEAVVGQGKAGGTRICRTLQQIQPKSSMPLLISALLFLVSVLIWFLIALLGLIATILGSISNFSCNTITFSQDRGGSLDSGPFYFKSNNIVFQQVGNSSQFGVDSCRPYSILDDAGLLYDDDSLTVTVRVFACIAVTSGFVSVFGVLAVPLFGTSMCAWNSYGCLSLVTCVAQALTLSIMSSSLCLDNPILQILEDLSVTGALRDSFEDECRPYKGYIFNVACVIFYGIAGILILIMPAPEKWQDDWCSEARQIDDEKDETTTKPVEGEETMER